MSANKLPGKIAIVGGGVSGLSTAYYLMQDARRLGVALDIHLFERKHSWGGNADTVVVNLGRLISPDGPMSDYLRWADLGVNDANLATYERMTALMKEIGYLDQMKPLEDTDSFSSADGAVALTDDTGMRFGVSDPAFSLQDVDDGLLGQLIKVVHQAALNLLGQVGLDYTCERYFKDCLDDPEGMLSRAAQQVGIKIDWSDPQLPARLQTVRDHYYYPRISAMYFTDDQGPQGMPLQSPFEYYRLQEGGGTPDRRYFDHGAQGWLEALANQLLVQSDAQVRTTLHTDAQVRVLVKSGQAWITTGKVLVEPFDLCVIATHADDARSMLRFEEDAVPVGEQLDDILGQVRYTRSYGVCHTASSVMPENKNVWRTYNIQIRSRDDSFFPYRISYVCNLHQNDPANPRYNAAGLPQYFVSLVDDLNRIPVHDMLDRVQDKEALPAELRAALPAATLRQISEGLVDSGYRHEETRVSEPLNSKAWTVFKHNVLDAPCILAQQAIQQFNEEVALALKESRQPVVPLLFGGGWTLGAGLQEQCLQQAQQISGWMLATGKL